MKIIICLHLLKLGVHMHPVNPVEIFRFEKLHSYVSLGTIISLLSIIGTYFKIVVMYFMGGPFVSLGQITMSKTCNIISVQNY